MRARWPPAPESGDILGAYAAVFELEDEDGAADQDDHVVHVMEMSRQPCQAQEDKLYYSFEGAQEVKREQ
jgi:hypothetical protein